MSSSAEDAGLRTVGKSLTKVAGGRNKIGKEENTGITGQCWISNESGPKSPAIIFPNSTEVPKYTHVDRKFTGCYGYDTWISPNERRVKEFRNFWLWWNYGHGI